MAREYPAGEGPAEHVANALQLLFNMQTYEMSSSVAVRYETTLLAIRDRLQTALAQLRSRPFTGETQ